jgi:hypothetical protein
LIALFFTPLQGFFNFFIFYWKHRHHITVSRPGIPGGRRVPSSEIAENRYEKEKQQIDELENGLSDEYELWESSYF